MQVILNLLLPGNSESVLQESACGCAGIYSSPVALALYAHAFETVGALEKLEGFASCFGADFYGMPRNKERITLVRKKSRVPEQFDFGDQVVVPMWAGRQLEWSVQS